MSGSGSQFWSILTEFSCELQRFKKMNLPNVITLSVSVLISLKGELTNILASV